MDSQKKGVGTSCRRAMVKEWAPEVRAIGLGTAPGMDLEHLGDCEKREAFCCFEGQPLQRIEATVSPENEASRRVLEK